MNKEKISFVIPCYNSELTIETVVNGIVDAVKDKYDYQIILSNDGSKDGVWNVIRKLCEKDSKIVGISLSRNFGQQCARMAALQYVSGEYVVFMDDDGQHPFDGIEKLIKKLEEGYDIVYASFSQKQVGLLHGLGSDINQRVMEWLIGKPKGVKLSAFFAVRRFAIDVLKEYYSPAPVINAYLLQITRNISNVELVHQKRIAGKSGYNLKKLFALWTNLVTAFSIGPLKLSGFVGGIMAGLGFLWTIVLVVKKLLNPMIPVGYTSMIAVILICCGFVMIMLGIHGEYIGRMMMIANNSPQYVIRETVNSSDDRSLVI